MDEERDNCELSELSLARVVAAARRGACSVTLDPVLVAAATDVALHRYEDAVIKRKRLDDCLGWAFRVGANAAKKLGKTSSKTRGRLGAQSDSLVVGGEARHACEDDVDLGDRPCRETAADALAALNDGRLGSLTCWQEQVLRKCLEPGMTFHRAARELGKDRSNVKKSFRRALARVKKSTDNAPPPLRVAALLSFAVPTPVLRKIGCPDDPCQNCSSSVFTALGSCRFDAGHDTRRCLLPDCS